MEEYQSNNQYYQNSTDQYRTPNPHQEPMKQKKPKKERKGLKLVASGLVFGLVAGITFQGVNLATDHFFKTDEPKIESTSEASDTEKQESKTTAFTSSMRGVADVAEQCMPSIVSITNMGVQEVRSWFGVQSQEVTSAGSGIIVGENDTELLIATNNHVVADSKTLTVTFIDDSCVEAQIKGTDAENDVAVVAVKLSDIEEETKAKIKVAVLGDSDSLAVGEEAIAIGNALGYGQSVTSGIISALNRTFNDASLSGTYIQTDAAINPGNSGGALLNSQGEVIGINVAKEASSEVDSMGYAIPITLAQPILDELMSRETRSVVDESERGALGIYGADVDASSAEMYNMPTGVYVSDLVSGGASEKAGIQKGDIITKLDGSTTSTMDGLKSLLQYYKSGETVTVTIQRMGNDGEYEEQEISVLLQSGSSLESEEDTQQSNNSNSGNSNGYGSNGSNGSNGFGGLFDFWR